MQTYNWIKERLQPEELRRQQDRQREISEVAQRLGCTVPQLAVAWCLKNESVQCLLLGATSPAQLYESIQSLQVTAILLGGGWDHGGTPYGEPITLWPPGLGASGKARDAPNSYSMSSAPPAAEPRGSPADLTPCPAGPGRPPLD